MSDTIINHGRYRIVVRDDGTIDAILNGDMFPFIRASRPAQRWIIMSGPELAKAAVQQFRFPPSLFVDSEQDARRWVELLAGLYIQAIDAASTRLAAASL